MAEPGQVVNIDEAKKKTGKSVAPLNLEPEHGFPASDAPEIAPGMPPPRPDIPYGGPPRSVSEQESRMPGGMPKYPAPKLPDWLQHGLPTSEVAKDVAIESAPALGATLGAAGIRATPVGKVPVLGPAIGAFGGGFLGEGARQVGRGEDIDWQKMWEEAGKQSLIEGFPEAARFGLESWKSPLQWTEQAFSKAKSVDPKRVTPLAERTLQEGLTVTGKGQVEAERIRAKFAQTAEDMIHDMRNQNITINRQDVVKRFKPLRQDIQNSAMRPDEKKDALEELDFFVNNWGSRRDPITGKMRGGMQMNFTPEEMWTAAKGEEKAAATGWSSPTTRKMQEHLIDFMRDEVVQRVPGLKDVKFDEAIMGELRDAIADAVRSGHMPMKNYIKWGMAGASPFFIGNPMAFAKDLWTHPATRSVIGKMLATANRQPLSTTLIPDAWRWGRYAAPQFSRTPQPEEPLKQDPLTLRSLLEFANPNPSVTDLVLGTYAGAKKPTSPR